MNTFEDRALRIKQLVAFLGLSNGKFADSITLNRSDFSRYLSGKLKISETLIARICLKYKEINPVWLLTGVGEMLNTPKGGGTNITINRGGNVSGSGNATAVGQSTASVATEKPSDEPKNAPMGIPYYDMEQAACGSLSGFGEALTMNNSSGSVVIPTLTTKDGDFFLATRGNSMVDSKHPERSIADGSMVLVREWRKNFIEWGEIYCVMTSDGYIVKKLYPSEDETKVMCVSSNSEEYPPYEILKSDIVGLGRVVAAVTTKLL